MKLYIDNIYMLYTICPKNNQNGVKNNFYKNNIIHSDNATSTEIYRFERSTIASNDFIVTLIGEYTYVEN